MRLGRFHLRMQFCPTVLSIFLCPPAVIHSALTAFPPSHTVPRQGGEDTESQRCTLRRASISGAAVRGTPRQRLPGLDKCFVDSVPTASTISATSFFELPSVNPTEPVVASLGGDGTGSAHAPCRKILQWHNIPLSPCNNRRYLETLGFNRHEMSENFTVRHSPSIS